MAKIIKMHITPQITIRLDPQKHIVVRGDKIIKVFNPITGEWVPYRAIKHLLSIY